MIYEIGNNYAYQAWNYYNNYYSNYYNNLNSLPFRGGGRLEPYNFGDTFQYATKSDMVTSPDKKEAHKSKDKKSEKPEKPKKEGLSTTSKVLIGLGVVAAGILALKCGKVSKAAQQTKKLAEKITFKPAQTVEEAVAFGKNNLGIKNYEGFAKADKDVVNFVNEALVNNSNMVRGNLTMVKNVRYVDDMSLLGNDTIAGMVSDVGHPNYGDLFINKRFFSTPDLQISRKLDLLKNVFKVEQEAAGTYRLHSSVYLDEVSLKPLITKFAKYKSGNMSFNEKIQFYNLLSSLDNVCNSIMNAPLSKIKAILKNNPSAVLEHNGAVINIEQIAKLPLKEQRHILGSMLNETKSKFTFDLGNDTPFSTIYHEMGHLQDKMPRCLTTDKLNYDYSKYSDELKAWVDNSDYMQIANQVSSYATHGPGEFIAETYAKLISGKKLPDEVINLYKKLNGPAIASI